MKIQMTFVKAGFRNWVFCDNYHTARVLWDSLAASQCTDIEAMENANRNNRRNLTRAELERK